ncbi:MAG TPA: DUF362 domain-containing protein, partial [Candidatus Hydrogenedentes bacterium]|nr:DUF362 domain-containing protein [Candidatus Hydrogenedentota bacterium]
RLNPRPSTKCFCLPKPPNNPVQHRATVAAVRGTDLATMARDALDAFGGAGAIVHEGETVFIKPNFGAFGMVKYNPVERGDCTKPEIVIAVAEECLKAGAKEVIIGDAGQSKRYDWGQVYTLDGTTTMAAEAARLASQYSGKITLACLNADSPGWTPVHSYTRLEKIYISSLIAQADRVISLPVLKSHRWTHITGAMKNFVGATSTARYGLGIQWRFRLHNAGIEQSFLDIVREVKPDFTILDCSVCCEGNGPHVCPGYWGETVDMRDRLGSWLLLSGADLAAVDATAARVISHDVSTITHLQMAYNQGIGQIQEPQIDLLGASLAELQVPWKKADITAGFLEVLWPGLNLLLGC